MRRRRAQHEGLQSCGLADDMLWRISDAMDRGLAHGVHSDAVAVDSSLSLLGWGQTFLPHYFRRAPSLLHRQLERWAGEAQAQRGLKLNVIGPRGGAKSTVATLTWVLRSVVEAHEPYVWIVSDTKQQAENHLESLKSELVDNAALIASYPRATGRGPVWRRHVIELRHGPVVEALGTGQRMRGRRRRENRPTLIVCDDLQNDDHIVSSLQRERTDRWFHCTLLKAGTRETNIVNLATALHRDALAMQLYRTAGWQSHIFPAVLRWPDRLDLWEQWERIYCDWERTDARAAARTFYDTQRAAMDCGAELLWPEEEDLYALMCMRIESGRAAFDREKQGSPANPDLCEWPESYFGPEAWFDEWPRQLAIKTLALDPSKGRDARHGDYSAFVLLGITNDGVMYVEADLARRPTPQIVAEGVELYRRFRPDAFGMEVNHFQELLGDEFARAFRAQGLPECAPWTIENHVPKLVRIRRLGPLLAQRRLRFRTASPGTRLLVNQLRDFPTADHDDGPDALEMAIRLAQELTQTDDASERVGERFRIG